jgi:hypothetical protein
MVITILLSEKAEGLSLITQHSVQSIDDGCANFSDEELTRIADALFLELDQCEVAQSCQGGENADDAH